MSPRKILIVDDDDDLRTVLRGLLSPLGTILEASNGVAALRLLKAEKPGVALLDVSMPEMDGLAVLRGALEIDPKLVVVMLTGEMDLHVAKRALEAGARAYITKPFDPNTIYADIARHAGLDADAGGGSAGRPWRVKR